MKRIGHNGSDSPPAYTFIIASDATYIVHPDKQRVLNEKFTAFDINKLKEGYQETELNGEDVYVFYEDLHNTRWTIGFVVKRMVVWMPVAVFGSIKSIYADAIEECRPYYTEEEIAEEAVPEDASITYITQDEETLETELERP